MYPIIYLSENFEIPVFYLVLSLVVCICLVWLNARVRKQRLDPKIALDTAIIVIISSFVGARLFHVLYENPEIYSANPWAIFYIWNGGFVFYGGALLAVICGLFLIRRRAPHEALRYLDLFAPVGSLAYALGRWGCFFAGCCHGKFCDLPWAVAGRHPTQLYASFWELGTLSLLLAFEGSPRKKSGQVFFLWISLHAVGRLMMEFFRDDFRGPNIGLSVSSWISLALLAIGIIGWLQVRRTALLK